MSGGIPWLILPAGALTEIQPYSRPTQANIASRLSWIIVHWRLSNHMWLRYRRKQSCEFGTCCILFVYPLVDEGDLESAVSSIRYWIP